SWSFSLSWLLSIAIDCRSTAGSRRSVETIVRGIGRIHLPPARVGLASDSHFRARGDRFECTGSRSSLGERLPLFCGARRTMKEENLFRRYRHSVIEFTPPWGQV